VRIRRVEADVFHADRRTDRHEEVNSRFSQFCEKKRPELARNLTISSIQENCNI